MSQKNPSDGGQKGFAVGRGLLAAAETLNFSMNEQRSGPQSRSMGSMVMGMGVGGSGGEIQDRNSQMPRRGAVGSHLGSTMKLFASLGLSPADLDALAQIPEENISVETLPHILMQLKSRKGEAGDRRMAGNPRDLPSMSPEPSYRGGREDWDDMHGGRMGGPSMGQSSARAQPQADYGYGSMQAVNPSRGYDLDYGSNNGSAGGRERQYSELSRRDSYGGLGMGPSSSDSVFMQRKTGSPSQGKVQDFLGTMPSMFPHVCSLCDFDVHSIMEWNLHTNGLRHAENRRLLLQTYPDWDPGMAQNRGRGGYHMDTPNLSAGLLGAAPMSQGQSAGGMPSSWGGGASSGFSNQGQSLSGQPKIRSRVVVAKYDRKPLSNKTLFSFCKSFGTLREHLVLKNKAFLEMMSYQEALDMVNYYKQHPAKMDGKAVTFYLSKELMVIDHRTSKDERSEDRANMEKVKGRASQVVYFANLPQEEEKKMEILTVAGRFGTVEKHLFMTKDAFVQLGTPQDAEMMVKYYSVNPLNIQGRHVRLNICTKYKTLTVSGDRRGDHAVSGGDSRGRRPRPGLGYNTTSSKSSSSKTTSASLSSSKNKEEKRKTEAKQAAREEKSKAEGEEVVRVLEGEEGREGEQKDPEKEEEPETKTSAPKEEKESEQLPAELQEVPEVIPDLDKAAEAKDVVEEEEEGNKGMGDHEMEPEGQTGSMRSPSGEPESREDTPADPTESTNVTEEYLPEDLEGSMEQDFLENMDDFVTLDELAEDEGDQYSEHSDAIDETRKGGLRVVNMVGFRRGHGFLEELLALAKPFGKVVKHLVLDLRPEAYLQFETEEEAKAMTTFYNGNVTANVCGKPVRISHSQSYPTIQCGASRVVYIGQLPSTKYTDDHVLKLAEPFGKVKKYLINRIRRECFVEMENAEDAEKLSESCRASAPKLHGKRLCVYVSRKYKQLKHGHRRGGRHLEERKAAKRESSSSSGSSVKSSKPTEEPPAKKPREETAPAEERVENEVGVEKKEEEVVVEKTKVEKMEECSPEVSSHEETGAAEPAESLEPLPQGSEGPRESPDSQKTPAADLKSDETEVEAEVAASTNQNTSHTENVIVEQTTPVDPKPASASLPLATYDSGNPIGVEYVKMGYYCRVCFLFYSNEDTAKKVHCSSQAHYDKVKKHLEKEQTKAQGNKKGRKTE